MRNLVLNLGMKRNTIIPASSIPLRNLQRITMLKRNHNRGTTFNQDRMPTEILIFSTANMIARSSASKAEMVPKLIAKQPFTNPHEVRKTPPPYV